jgi:hypothetical protein
MAAQAPDPYGGGYGMPPTQFGGHGYGPPNMMGGPQMHGGGYGGMGGGSSGKRTSPHSFSYARKLANVT